MEAKEMSINLKYFNTFTLEKQKWEDDGLT